jgi:hypothetical protein
MILPEQIERDYMRFRASVVRQIAAVTDSALRLRTDAEDNPDLIALLALLGLTADAIIDRRKLRARLYRFAHRLSDFERAQLATILGSYVHRPNPLLIEAWVDDQEVAITKSAETLLGRASVALGGLAIGGAASLVLANQVFTPEEARVGVAASSAALTLNARFIANISTNAGGTHYRWITVDDEVVRDNHAALHFTIQSWALEPAGGGTKEDESGHPGSGFGCRCVADPIVPGVTS